MENKKIAIVMPSLGFGGAERVATSYANWIINNTDNEVYIIKFDDAESSYPVSEKVNIVNYVGKNKGRISSIFDRYSFLRKNLRKNKIDVVFAMFANMELYCYFAKRRACKLIGSERCNINKRTFFGKILSKISSRLCDGFIFQTEGIKKLYPKSVIKKSIVIPNAISNQDVFKVKQLEKENIITAMGRLDSQKGFDLLISSFSEILKKHKDYKLIIYGEGQERKNLEEQVVKLKLEEKVFLPGTSKKAIYEIAKSKIFVLSSRFEGMPNALIEAMAIGNACISTNCDFGPSELIVNEENGILINVDDRDALIDSINYLIENEEKRKQIEKRAIELKEKLQPENIYRKYYEFFSKILNKKSIVKRLIGIIKSPKKIIFFLDSKGLLKLLNDEAYLKLYYRLRINKKLDLDNPKTFNEKLQWLKLNDRKPEYTNMVDKYEVREYIKNAIGEEYLIPLIGVYDKFEDIDFEELPNQFVIKCTHDSGGLVICKNKNEFNIEEAKEKINRSFKKNYYYHGREYPYKNIKPRIIIEKYMEDYEEKELIDYKVMTFNGTPKIVFTCTERYKDGLKVTFFDMGWKKMPFERHYPSSKKEIKKPENFDMMIEFSKKLAKDITFLRVDWYEINNKLYFGELTFYPGSGLEEFTPEEWDLKLGELIKLPPKTKTRGKKWEKE